MPASSALEPPLSPTLPNAEWKRHFRRRLLAWYRRHCRDLPWRRSADPYRVWISEIMLQQTQVATVIPYFERFVASFPDIKTLAQAPEQQVLQHWEGLGYYRRARQLHRAAQVIMSEHGGRFPRSLADVRTLPGIGRYTAGAIVSIAFDTPAPILEANTVRLYSRLVAFAGDVGSAAGQQLLWGFAEDVLPQRSAGSFNQALMELGSLICTPRKPRCEACPVTELCPAWRHGLQEQLPAPRLKPRVEEVREATVAVWRQGKVLLRQRQAGERWAGLWDFPRFPLSARRGSALREELVAAVRELSGITVELDEHMATLKHGVTRFRITLDCYSARFVAGRKSAAAPALWLKPDQLDGYPLSVTGRKFGRMLQAAARRSGDDRRR